MEIECQQELGTEGLLDDDCYLAECNLGDLEDTSGVCKGDLLASSHSSRTGSKQTRGNTDSASRNSPEQYLERAYLETSVVWLHSHSMYPGESPGRRVSPLQWFAVFLRVYYMMFCCCRFVTNIILYSLLYSIIPHTHTRYHKYARVGVKVA